MFHVLILEDDSLSRQLIKDTLKHAQKWNIVESDTVQSALRETKKKEFDMLLLDNNLPDGTASDFCHSLLQMKRQTHTPKWILTGEKPLEKDKVLWRSLGLSGFLVKPIEVDTLLEITRQCQLR